MKKTCAVSKKEFEITESDLKFYERLGVSIPTLCPEERQRRRISFRNFRSLYHRRCDATDKKIISMYHADQPFPVYDQQYWWGDGWDPKDYGKDFDFSRPFFEQYKEMSDTVPRYAIANVQCENSEYSNFAWGSRNCYLVFGCVRDEDCMYGHIVWDSKNCVDNLYLFRCEWCSNCTDCMDCYDLHFSTECTSCNESYFLHDCRSCLNCFACTNLRNKEYYFFNKECTKEEYEEKLKKVFPLTPRTITDGKKWLEKLKKEECIYPPLFGTKNEDVSGNHIYESKNVVESYDAKQGEDSKALYTAYKQIHCQDISFTGDESRFSYNCLTIGQTENLICCHKVFMSNDIAYSECCYSSHDLFGCMGMRNAAYCILNKQYSKEEYFALREKIIEHMKKTPLRQGSAGQASEWGEFFPIELSPFAYNEAIVNEYYPLTKEEVIERDWKWREEENGTKYEGPKYEIPDDINDVKDEILDKILTCEKTGKNYRIVKPELEFYRRMKLPIPRLCPDRRHEARIEIRNPRKLWDRKCDKCGIDIQTTFSPDRPEQIYCEKCYLECVE